MAKRKGKKKALNIAPAVRPTHCPLKPMTSDLGCTSTPGQLNSDLQVLRMKMSQRKTICMLMRNKRGHIYGRRRRKSRTLVLSFYALCKFAVQHFFYFRFQSPLLIVISIALPEVTCMYKIAHCIISCNNLHYLIQFKNHSITFCVSSIW
jgi:hypothetical protein